MKKSKLIRLYNSITNIDDEFIEEARTEADPDAKKSLRRKNKILRFLRPAGLVAAAAAIIVCSLSIGKNEFTPSTDWVITAYAYGEEQEITSAGANFTTGKLDEFGVLSGHPLLFYLSGEQIASVRFSCKNEKLNFIDMTDQRNEYGYARNFTVEYGENENEYGFLLIDWVPDNLVTAMWSGKYASIQELPKELREDTIVMEVVGLDGKTATKAIFISLDDDGTFHASFDDYTITEEDTFVGRPDAESISRHIFYEQGNITVNFCDQDGNEVPTDAGWHVTNDVDHIVVRWEGRYADTIQMFFWPSGTETLEEMELLETKIHNSAENVAVFSAEPLHRDSLMGHMDFVIDLGGGLSIHSDQFEVIYDTDYYDYIDDTE